MVVVLAFCWSTLMVTRVAARCVQVQQLYKSGAASLCAMSMATAAAAATARFELEGFAGRELRVLLFRGVSNSGYVWFGGCCIASCGRGCSSALIGVPKEPETSL